MLYCAFKLASSLADPTQLLQLGHDAHVLLIVRQVWAVLTDYDALADFIPALAVSERLQHPSGDANLVRLRQVPPHDSGY